MKLRLDILGYTLQNSKVIFTEGIKNLIAERTEYDMGEDDFVLKHLRTLDQVGFIFWLDLVKKILSGVKISKDEEVAIKDRDIFGFLTGDGQIEDTQLGYPNVSMGHLIRGLLEVVEDEDEVLLDMTALVVSGYYTENEPVCNNAVQRRMDSTLEFQKIIILTEGNSDSKILSSSLMLLYPEVADYFSFLDFGSSKSEGGSSALERTVKSFAAAGINNKILALFDNDAAGLAAQKRLLKSGWPKNIEILTLPNLTLGDNYPTVGAQGATFENINGRACSIELYLGEDILKQANNLIPIRWKNLEDQINVYQGEVFQKNDIQELFFKKLNLSKTGELQGDWSGIRLIFEDIFTIAGTM